MKVKKQYNWGGITVAQIKYNLGNVGGMAVTELWSGSAGNFSGSTTGVTLTLNDDITNYKFLVFCFKVANNVTDIIQVTKLISVEQIKNLINDNKGNVYVSFVWGYSSNDDYFNLVHGTTAKILHCDANKPLCTRIVGIN